MGMPVILTIIAVSAFILIILVSVFLGNTRSRGQGTAKATASPSPSPEVSEDLEIAEGQEDMETLYREHKLRAEDLDFWDMYKDKDIILGDKPSKEKETGAGDLDDESLGISEGVSASPGAGPSGSPGAGPSASPGVDPSASPGLSPVPSHEPTEEEMAADGKHVKVSLKDGTEKWVEISEDIPPMSYDFTNIRISDGKMAYYEDGEKHSFLGVDLSKGSGEVDFGTLKALGVDFVMLRLGSRGYETGLVSLDEKFVNNITKAQNAGLEVGVTFFSQAVTVTEAKEEAQFVISNLVPYHITYPVAYEMEYIVNDESRIDILDEKGKAQVAQAFLEEIEREGYRSILYGSKNWLLGELASDKLLEDQDVWLSDQAALPDYPYQFKMWKYAAPGQISGVENDAAYIISFVDYTRK